MMNVPMRSVFHLIDICQFVTIAYIGQKNKNKKGKLWSFYYLWNTLCNYSKKHDHKT